MNNEAAKAAKDQTGAAPQIVNLRDRVPQMSDAALATLLDNARRLLGAGSMVQRNSAADLIPVVEAEIAGRRAAKAATTGVKKTSGAKMTTAKKRKAQQGG